MHADAVHIYVLHNQQTQEARHWLYLCLQVAVGAWYLQFVIWLFMDSTPGCTT